MAEKRSLSEAVSRSSGRICNLFLGCLLLLAPAARAQSIPVTFSKIGSEYHLTLQPNPALYFGLQQRVDLLLPWTTRKMALGIDGPTFVYPPVPGETRGFFRARGISVSAPEDLDNDGMDDVWEITHMGLDPLLANDANLDSTEPDALPGESNLEYYQRKRGIVPLKQVYSREVTTFNFGAAISAVEAISRPVSVFNGQSIPFGAGEVYSRETSVFNFGSPLVSTEAISRETSVFNFGSPLVSVEAISRQVSVFNGQSVPTGAGQVYSREVTAFNFGAPTAGVEAISREVSVNNTIPQ